MMGWLPQSMKTEEQQMDQLMARLTVVQQQLMSVWVPGLREESRSRVTSKSLVWVTCVTILKRTCQAGASTGSSAFLAAQARPGTLGKGKCIQSRVCRFHERAEPSKNKGRPLPGRWWSISSKCPRGPGGTALERGCQRMPEAVAVLVTEPRPGRHPPLAARRPRRRPTRATEDKKSQHKRGGEVGQKKQHEGRTRTSY